MACTLLLDVQQHAWRIMPFIPRPQPCLAMRVTRAVPCKEDASAPFPFAPIILLPLCHASAPSIPNPLTLPPISPLPTHPTPPSTHLHQLRHPGRRCKALRKAGHLFPQRQVGGR